MADDLVNSELFLEKELLAPYSHLAKVKGKQLRMKIPLAFNHWLKVPEDKLNFIVNSVQTLHEGTILLDDVQDDSVVRRGLPAAHCVFGVPLTLNASLHVMLMALLKICKLNPTKSIRYLEDFLDMGRGHGFEIYWRENFVCPTEEEYKNMVKRKTGGMMLISVNVLQDCSENKTDFRKLVLLLGLYFQIRDDYCNLSEQEALEEWPGAGDTHASKENTFCEDITEGKFSLPIIHAFKTPAREEILSILRQRTRDIKLKKRCILLLEEAGSLQYTRDTLLDLDRAARAEVARLGGNPEMEAVLDELLSWRGKRETNGFK